MKVAETKTKNWWRRLFFFKHAEKFVIAKKNLQYADDIRYLHRSKHYWIRRLDAPDCFLKVNRRRAEIICKIHNDVHRKTKEDGGAAYFYFPYPFKKMKDEKQVMALTLSLVLVMG